MLSCEHTRTMYASGEPVSGIAKFFGVTRPTIYRVLETAEPTATP